MVFTIILSNRTVTNDSVLLIYFLLIVIVSVKSTDVNTVAAM